MDAQDSLTVSDARVIRMLIGATFFFLSASVVAYALGIWVFHISERNVINEPSLHVGTPLILSSFVPYIWLIRLARAAYAGKTDAIISAAVGLAYGGQIWLGVVALTLPTSDAQALDWLRGHAWDYLGAGGLAAVVWHLLISKRRAVRTAALQFSGTIIAAITAFTVEHSTIVSVAIVTFFGGILGLIGCRSYVRIAGLTEERSDHAHSATETSATPSPLITNRAERRRAQRRRNGKPNHKRTGR